jgi:hypothetical protein
MSKVPACGMWSLVMILIVPMPGRTQSSPEAKAIIDAHSKCLELCSRQHDSCLKDRQTPISVCADKVFACNDVCTNAALAAEKKLEGSGGSEREHPAQVSDTCLSIEKSIMGTQCASGGRHWYWTMVRASRRAGCPHEVYFTYEENGEKQGKVSTPLNVQTCGGPPQNVRATD